MKKGTNAQGKDPLLPREGLKRALSAERRGVPGVTSGQGEPLCPKKIPRPDVVGRKLGELIEGNVGGGGGVRILDHQSGVLEGEPRKAGGEVQEVLPQRGEPEDRSGCFPFKEGVKVVSRGGMGGRSKSRERGTGDCQKKILRGGGGAPPSSGKRGSPSERESDWRFLWKKKGKGNIISR